MTDAFKMPPFILADAEPLPTWLTLLMGGGGVAAFGAITALFQKLSDNRTAKRTAQITAETEAQKALSQERNATHAADVSVELERMKISSAAEKMFLDQLASFNTKHEQAERDLRTELENMRNEHANNVRSLNHEIRNLRNQVNLTQGGYHELYSYTRTIASELRHNRARLKRLMDTNGEKYSEDEFPPIDETIFDPKRLFSSFGAKDNAQFMPSKRATARIEILDETQEP